MADYKLDTNNQLLDLRDVRQLSSSDHLHCSIWRHQQPMFTGATVATWKWRWVSFPLSQQEDGECAGGDRCHSFAASMCSAGWLLEKQMRLFVGTLWGVQDVLIFPPEPLMCRERTSMGVCCFRYQWDNELWSWRSSLSVRFMSLKAYQMPGRCTVVCNTLRPDFTTLESHHSRNHFVFLHIVCKQ